MRDLRALAASLGAGLCLVLAGTLAMAVLSTVVAFSGLPGVADEPEIPTAVLAAAAPDAPGRAPAVLALPAPDATAAPAAPSAQGGGTPAPRVSPQVASGGDAVAVEGVAVEGATPAARPAGTPTPPRAPDAVPPPVGDAGGAPAVAADGVTTLLPPPVAPLADALRDDAVAAGDVLDDLLGRP